MSTTLSWIKAYVPNSNVTAQEYTDAMTFTGTKVEGYACLDKNLEKIVVREIPEVKGHPDADKLVVYRVSVGEGGPVQIVTSAPNVTEKSIGGRVSVVLDGSRVAGGHDGGGLPEEGIKIKRDKLRGVESCSMMCSVEELRTSRDMYPDAPGSGICILPGDSVPNSDAVGIMSLRGVVFEYEITSNRVDCCSMTGIARETAATFRRSFHAPVVTPTGDDEDIHDYPSMQVENSGLCPRHCARMVRNMRLAPSPRWMQRRLAADGIHPINDIVDITNYVMEEYRQPTHAFDYDQLAGHEVVAKYAKDGGVFQTLDKQERKLDSTILMINDEEKEVGIAGIMGKENSKITDNVRTMVFESTCFNGTNIHLSAKRAGLRTDTSGKYEKGLDPNTAEEVVSRAYQLIEELGAGEVVGNVIDLYPKKRTSKRIPFDVVKTNRFLGIEILEETMLSCFKTIELGYDPKTKEVIALIWRQDLECMTDLAEGMARFYGYDKILTTLPSGEITTGKLSYKLQIEEVTREIIESCGFSQGMTYSFENPRVFNRMLIPEDSALKKTVEVSNPLGEDSSAMHTISLNGMLTLLPANYSRRNKNVHLCELVSMYRPKSLPLAELPDERMQFALGMYGNGDFFTMEGMMEGFFEKAGIHERPRYNPGAECPYLHPGRKTDTLCDGTVVGSLDKVRPDVADSYKIGDRVCVAVIDMPSIMGFTTFDRRYIGITGFPAVTRDISMVVLKGILVGQIEDMIIQRRGEVLESYRLFNVYRGAQVLTDHKSVAYSITFRAKDHTLEEKEVTSMMNKILSGLSRLGIELRA